MLDHLRHFFGVPPKLQGVNTFEESGDLVFPLSCLGTRFFKLKMSALINCLSLGIIGNPCNVPLIPVFKKILKNAY